MRGPGPEAREDPGAGPIFVLGASGMLGRAVVGHLLESGVSPARIAAAGRRMGGLADLADCGVRAEWLAKGATEGMARMLEGIETLVLIPGVGAAPERFAEHAGALDAARRVGVRRLILVSAGSGRIDSVDAGAPFALYAESSTRQGGMAWLILRTNPLLEHFAAWAPAAMSEGRLPSPIRRGKAAYVARDDVARAAAAAALDPAAVGEVLQLTGPAALAMPQIAACLAEATGCDIRCAVVGESEFLDRCTRSGESPQRCRLALSRYRAVEAGEYARVTMHVEALTGRPARGAREQLSAGVRGAMAAGGMRPAGR